MENNHSFVYPKGDATILESILGVLIFKKIVNNVNLSKVNLFKESPLSRFRFNLKE